MDAPIAWLTDHAGLLPAAGDALDVACGRGRNALWLAGQGLTVTAIDRNADALEHLSAAAAARGLSIDRQVKDLEAGRPSLGSRAFDVIVVTNYLHRPLFEALIEALRPGGLLIYETFTRAQAAIGKPTNPDFLLEPGELFLLVQPLQILDLREGLVDGRYVASVVARFDANQAR